MTSTNQNTRMMARVDRATAAKWGGSAVPLDRLEQVNPAGRRGGTKDDPVRFSVTHRIGRPWLAIIVFPTMPEPWA